MEYYLFISNDCNLNCKYCSILLNQRQLNVPIEPIYSLFDLQNFIDATQKKYNDNIADIILFGGEPTLNYTFIEKLIQMQKSLNDLAYEIHYMLHTNGLLLYKISDYILNNIDSIMLSINYDKVPRIRLDSGYFKNIIDSVHYIKQKRNIPIVARLTITEVTSLYSEISLFNPFFDAVYWQIENKYDFNNFEEFYNTYKFELNLVFELWMKYLECGIFLRFIPFIASVNFLSENIKPKIFCCGYNNSMIYIQTDGKCYTCAEDLTTNKNLVGSINTDFKFSNFNLLDTLCNECPYLVMCKGRCGRMHKEFTPEHVKNYCKLNTILFDLIKSNYEKIIHLYNKYNIPNDLKDPIFHYTEYTP